MMALKCDTWTPSDMMPVGRLCQRDEGHYPETPHRYEGQQGNLILEWCDEDDDATTP